MGFNLRNLENLGNLGINPQDTNPRFTNMLIIFSKNKHPSAYLCSPEIYSYD
jgi:hypothetical protein